ncbi:hypothetical protein [Peribacillus alkalitolerans]|uniref:hypothetical protein n=1 Tax=Peribacillus alkalitolerans TaxID=1550385 RepID=UPI0013D43D12|nr:hypothetical protein [Peribacillus alkalitolerans]
MNMGSNIDQQVIISEISKIKVTKRESKDVMVDNPTDLPLISLDKKGATFKIDDHRCVRYYKEIGEAEEEVLAYQLGDKLGLTPKIYGWSPAYVVMEHIQAPTVAEHLTKHPITKELTNKLLQLLEDFKAVGYKRIDHSLEYIYMLPDGSFKITNLRHKFTLGNVLPKRLIKGMGTQVDAFLAFVKEINPTLFQQWEAHPEFSEGVSKAKRPKKKEGE